MNTIFYSVLTTALVFILGCDSKTQDKNAYGVEVTNNMATYHKQVEADPNKELIDLEVFIPGLLLDIRYATTNNFTGAHIYQLPKAFARKPVAEAILRIQEELKTKGLGLKIFDAYRPYAATVKFYEIYKDTTYVASPYRGSRHNRGCAVDLTLIDLLTKEELTMPTSYDSFEERAHADFPLEDHETFTNRELLKSVMHKHGFKVYTSEWWHFDFIGWEAFELLDIEFEELMK